LKEAVPFRLAELSVPYFQRAGIGIDPSPIAMEYLASVMPIASESVDRLDQVPARLHVLFTYSANDALVDATIGAEMMMDGPQAVARTLAEELASAPRLDREKFRAVANTVKARTGQKGRALFHPIRVVLTGRAEGPELDLIVPAIDRGADLPADSGVPKILGCRERATAFVAALNQRVPEGL
jgi:hypothetical protein